MRTLTAVAGNSQRLDGGAMFGSVPRAMWSRWIEPDDRNRIPLACRCLLVRELANGSADSPDRYILLEAGIGAFFAPKLKDRYGVVESHHVLLDSLAQIGVHPHQIDVVVLSHLHFDHAGGLLTAWQPQKEPELVFPRARFLVGAEAWERATRPHPRDRASFVPELNQLLESSGRLELVTGWRSALLGEGYRFHYSDGHTPGLTLTEVAMPGGPVVYVADLIPGRAWIHLPITMGYDRYPELLVGEKERLLTDLVARGGRIVYTHDPEVALSAVAQDERGQFVAVEAMRELRDLAA